MNFVEIANTIAAMLPPRCEIRLTVLNTADEALETQLEMYDYETDTEYEGLVSSVGIGYDIEDLLDARTVDREGACDED